MKKLTKKTEPIRTPSLGTWFLRNRQVVPFEKSTEVPQHVGEIYLMCVLIRN